MIGLERTAHAEQRAQAGTRREPCLRSAGRLPHRVNQPVRSRGGSESNEKPPTIRSRWRWRKFYGSAVRRASVRCRPRFFACD